MEGKPELKSRPVSNNTVGRKTQVKKKLEQNHAYQNNQMAEKSRKSLVTSSYGVRKPPKKPSQASIESGRVAMQQSQTTKEDSMGTNIVDYSLENIHVSSLGQFASQQKHIGQSRVQSGLGLRIKNSLNTHQSKGALPAGNPLFTQESENQNIVKSSQQLRRPMTSIQTSQMQQSIIQQNTTEMSTLRDRPSEEQYLNIQNNQTANDASTSYADKKVTSRISQIAATQSNANDNKQSTQVSKQSLPYRIKSAIYHRQANSNKSQKMMNSERHRTSELASFNQ